MQKMTLADWLDKSDDAVLLDVRESDEFARGHLPGALNRPLSTIDNWKQDLVTEQRYAIMCQMGGRAQRASDILAEQGLQLIVLTDGFGVYQGPVEEGKRHE